MKTKHALCGCILGLFLLAAGTLTTHAAITVYTDHATWQAAAGGGSFTLDSLNEGTLNRGTYTISGTAQNAFPNGNVQTTIDGSGYLRVLLGGENSFTLFTFNTPLFALGYDINPQNFNLGATVFIAVDGVAAGSYTLPATDVNGFRGFISDVAFTTFEVRNSETAWHGIDNVEIVPEPSSALLLLGSAMMLALRRRTHDTKD